MVTKIASIRLLIIKFLERINSPEKIEDEDQKKIPKLPSWPELVFLWKMWQDKITKDVHLEGICCISFVSSGVVLPSLGNT